MISGFLFYDYSKYLTENQTPEKSPISPWYNIIIQSGFVIADTIHQYFTSNPNLGLRYKLNIID